MLKRFPYAWLLGVSIVLLVLDYYTKQLASAHLVYAQPNEVLPILNITLHHNPGAAWSFLGNAGGWQRWLFSGLAVVMSVVFTVMLLRLKNNAWLAVALSLLIGGAIGNLIDRLVLGYVVDFISFHWQDWYFPTFNVADIGISVGAIMLAIDAFFLESRRSQRT